MSQIEMDRELRIALDYAYTFEKWGFKCAMLEDEPGKILIVVRRR